MNKQKTLINAHSSNWLQHSSLFTNPHVRGFISESGIVFKFVQRVSHNRELLNHSELLQSSRKYRSVIHSWLIKLSKVEQQQQQSAENDLVELSQMVKMLHKMEIAWHLCEIMLMDIRGPGQQAGQLLNWVKWHFTGFVELADQVIVADLPQMHEFYWDVILFFALRGDMENAAMFLELHSESQTDSVFIMVLELLRKYPVLTNMQVYHEYYIRFEIWHESVLHTIEQQKIPPESNKKSYIQMNLLLHLLAGEIGEYSKVTHLFDSWYQMLISFMIFTDPCLKQGRFFENYANKIINIYHGVNEESNRSQLEPFDELILCILFYEMPTMISQLSFCFNDNWWFVTHFIDLLYNSDGVKDFQFVDVQQLRESFVPDYADSLMTHQKQFWQLSIEYLEQCKDSLEHIRLCLERVPFKSQRQLQTLVSLAKRFNLTDIELSLYKIEARRWLTKARQLNQHNQYGSALFWAIRSKDKMLINSIVDRYLYYYLKTSIEGVVKTEKIVTDGILLDADMIANIGNAIVISERLIFLCKYYEFHQLQKQGQHSAAATILVDMLASNAIPQYFIFQVILDCLPLLESSNVVIDIDQTSKILASFETIVENLQTDRQECSLFFQIGSNWNMNKSITFKDEELEQIKTHQRNIIKKHENVLRLAIARNLSRNFVMPRSELSSCQTIKL
ncbi:Nucleoporin nup85 [Blomia tropicalis]|nr:Nucleoporin nup85 [Blomia tropicalis]